MKTLLLISALLLLTSCITEFPSDTSSVDSAAADGSTQLMREAREFSVVAVTSPDFSPRPGQTFAWYSDIIWASDVVQQDAQISEDIRGYINSELTKRGYQVIEDRQSADFVIGAGVSDGSSEIATELQGFFQLFPSVDPSGSPTSTFYVGVIYPNDIDAVSSPQGVTKVLWRSSIQAYILGDKVTEEFRDQRLQVFTSKLMRSMP